MSLIPTTHICGFCGIGIAEVELLFRSSIGGLPPEICSDCVDGFHDVVTVHRKSPELAADLIAAHNTFIDQGGRR